MSNPISGARSDDWWVRRHEDDGPVDAARAPTTPATPPPVRELPDPVVSPHVKTAAPLAPSPQPSARDAQVQRGLDAFRMSLTGWYHTPSGDVAAGTPFIMRPGYDEQRALLARPENRAVLQDAARHAGLSTEALARVECGRGTPGEIHALAQALVDARPAGKVWRPGAVEKLMFESGIGIDCAGYVQQAYLHATGRTRAQAGFDTVMNESLSGLAHRGYERVGALAGVRAGDLIVLSPMPGERGDPGHRAIVYDQRLATADDMRTLLATSKGQAFAVGGPDPRPGDGLVLRFGRELRRRRGAAADVAAQRGHRSVGARGA